MGSKICRIPDVLSIGRDQYGVFDDFVSFTDTQLWTVANVGAGTTLAHEGSVGRSTLKFFTTTAANDSAILATTNEIFKFKANKAIFAESRIIFTDVNTDDGFVGFGFADAIAATTMADTTGAITATDACLIYKLPNTTVWAFHTEINGSVTGLGSATIGSVSDTTAGGASFQTLRIEIVPRSSTVFEARPYVDGVQLKTSAGTPIMHTITLGTATDLDFGLIHKTGHTDDFTMYCDYIFAAQVRD